MRLIDTHDHVLSTYDRQIAIYATEQFQRQGIQLVMGCRVRTSLMSYHHPVAGPLEHMLHLSLVTLLESFMLDCHQKGPQQNSRLQIH